MEIAVYSDTQGLAEAIADRIVRQLRRAPDSVLALASGKTPVPIYAELVRRHRRGEVSFAQATVFALDEYLGVARSDPRSFGAFFDEHLFGHIDLPASAAFVPDGMAADPAHECRAFEARILAAGGLDLCLLGVGVNGHLAMNEPGPVLAAQAHVAEISDQTRASFPPGLEKVRYGLTVGMATIFNAAEVILAATGAAKAPIITRALLPVIDPQVPASFLQLHPNAFFAVDAEAGRNIVGARLREGSESI